MRLGIPALTLAALLLVVLGACTSSPAATPTSAGIAVSGAWARAAAMNGTSAAYLTIANGGSTADRLLSVSTPAAMSAQVHQTMSDPSGMTGMQPVAGVDIPAGGQVTLEPGGYHIMLMELTKPLAPGETIQLTLVFEKTGPVVVMAEVRQG
jgi:periplasmic copper chaperone A